MSRYLWKYYWEDDLDRFRQLLQHGGVAGRMQDRKESGVNISQAHSPGSSNVGVLSSSYPARSSVGKNTPSAQKDDVIAITLTRADINVKDAKGLTLLHHTASTPTDNAQQFALALIVHPHIDLYAQDYENGWTALHRAFYFGNITIARAILERDNAGVSNSSGNTSQPPSLMQVKDREGHGPYDILTATIADRSLRTQDLPNRTDDSSSSNGEHDPSHKNSEQEAEHAFLSPVVHPTVDVRADELFAFGTNKNLSLGFGDQDDRHHPERITLKRPKRLFRRFSQEHYARKANEYSKLNSVYAEKLLSRSSPSERVDDLQDVLRFKPLYIQDVQMSKFHTVVLTTDPIANLYVCGHGVGGRLGTGNEKTLFNFTCVDAFGSSRISSVALGQDHTLAVNSRGELYTWGSNKHGQLGCGLPKESPKSEDVIQLSPRQIFGLMKKETIIGIAASRIHSVAHTGNALFTFGKNEGQLGLVDSQAGTLKVQSTPRQVYASRFSSNIFLVTAIDRATVILLENREVHVFANYGAVKLQFPLDGFSNYFLRQSFLATKYDTTPNSICKITSGGETICALSTSGKVFTLTVDQRVDPGSSGHSTTNPNKIRAALSTPYRAWSLKNDRMAAQDVGIDADGSIILATKAGGVFRRVRRPKTANTTTKGEKDRKTTEFKFMRVPNMTRAIAVRASSSGAYFVLREDCNVTRAELEPPSKTIWQDIFSLLPFSSLADESPAPTFWQRPDNVKRLTEAIAHSQDVETDVATIIRRHPSRIQFCDIELHSSSSEFIIPAHQVILAGRSTVLRYALATYYSKGGFSCDAFSIILDEQKKPILTFEALDFLTLVDLVVFLYADALVGFWRLRHDAPQMAFRYKQVRSELMKIASKLELRNLEVAARKVITRPDASLAADFELALLDPSFYAKCDARVQLGDGEILVHSVIMSNRCPFFKGLFHGHAKGKWISARRAGLDSPTDLTSVDLEHIELRTFKLVVRYIYADAREELFDDVITSNIDEFLDIVMDVLSVANELMLDDLSRTCQAVLGRYVTTRNACQLLNAVAPCAIQDFKNVTLEYLCLSLESVLANHWLDELDEDLLRELDKVVQQNQCAAMPFVRSGRMEAVLNERHPELAELKSRAKQAKIDALEIRAKFPDAGSASNVSTSKPRSSPSIQSLSSPSELSKYPATPERSQTSEKSSASVDPLSSIMTPSDVTLISAESPVPASKPWGSTPFKEAKLGLKDIMAQTSPSRTSNLSLGLQSQARAELQPSSSSSSKISQKERKRQQQQQRSEIENPPMPSPSSSISTVVPGSPWIKVSPSGKAASSEVGSNPTNNGSDTLSQSTRTPNAPQLTMRQTVAHAPSPKQKRADVELPKTPPKAQRSVSTPIQSTSSVLNRSSESPQESPGPRIQSIRHQPRPMSSHSTDIKQSLSEIMSREQAEKTTLKDSVAKRSLQEIQEEQAFQVRYSYSSITRSDY